MAWSASSSGGRVADTFFGPAGRNHRPDSPASGSASASGATFALGSAPALSAASALGSEPALDSAPASGSASASGSEPALDSAPALGAACLPAPFAADSASARFAFGLVSARFSRASPSVGAFSTARSPTRVSLLAWVLSLAGGAPWVPGSSAWDSLPGSGWPGTARLSAATVALGTAGLEPAPGAADRNAASASVNSGSASSPGTSCPVSASFPASASAARGSASIERDPPSAPAGPDAMPAPAVLGSVSASPRSSLPPEPVLRSLASGLALPSSVAGRDGTRLKYRPGLTLRTNSRVVRKCPPFHVGASTASPIGRACPADRLCASSRRLSVKASCPRNPGLPSVPAAPRTQASR